MAPRKVKKHLSTHVCNATDMLLPRLQSHGAVEARITTASPTAFALETGEVVCSVGVWVVEEKKLHKKK